MKSRTMKMMMVGMAVTVGLFVSQVDVSAKQAVMTPGSSGAVRMVVKIDLAPAKVSAVRTGASGGMDNVRVSVLVSGSAIGNVCSGPFKVSFEKDTGGSWTFLQQGGVANLCVDRTRAKLPSQMLHFSDTVPSGMAGAQKYRVVVDYTNMVDESNEANNVGGARYRP